MARKRLCKVVDLTLVKRRVQAVVAENYVYHGDQLVAVRNATGAIQYECFDGICLDYVFADQTVFIGVLWPLEDVTGAPRNVISTAGVVLDHRKIDSFGKITSQTGATVDYDQFFSGLSWYADNSNFPMGLLLAGTLTPGGMPGFGLVAGTLGTAEKSRTS